MDQTMIVHINYEGDSDTKNDILATIESMDDVISVNVTGELV